MNALIIGGAGFVGKYLIKHLSETYSWHLSATKLPGEQLSFPGIDVYDLNLLDKSDIIMLLKKTQPDYIFHLAAQSSVALSWARPDLTVDINIKGSLYLLDALRECHLSSRVLMIGSGEEYGYIEPDETPVNESTLLRPGNIYAATKACQNMISGIYAKAYNLPIIMVRAFNHIGPEQSPTFVVSDFCKQVAEIELTKKTPVLQVGNLSAKRDFSDVRDVVRAYGMLIQKGSAGETYNVGSGHAIAIEELLNFILKMSKIKIEVQVSKQKLRPVDIPIIEADVTKLQGCISWQPRITIQQTISETLDYWRSYYKKEGM